MSTTGGGSMDHEQGAEHVEQLDLEPVATVRRPRRQALWAVLGFVGLVAGGLVVSSANDDGERPGLPVDLASAARSGGGDAEAAADSMLAWVAYVPGDDLPALGGEATAYRLTGDVDEDQVRALADAVGLDGDVRDEGGGRWSVTGDGGLGRVDVYTGGGVYWSYFAGYQDCVEADGSVGGCNSEDCVTNGDVTGCTFSDTGTAIGGSPAKPMCGEGVECVEPTTTTITGCQPVDPCPPEPDVVLPTVNCDRFDGDEADLPTGCDTGSSCAADDCLAPDELPAEEDARQVALDVVAATGADVDGARVEASPGPGSWYITVEPILDGIPSGLLSSVEVGPDLQVLSGNGTFGAVEALGEYPLLDTRAAIERANAQSGSFGGIEPAMGAADAVEGTTGGAEAGGTDVGGTDDVEVTVTTVVEGTDPCAVPEGASDGCGGTTGCGGDGCVPPETTIPCKVQADGSEICELTQCSVDSATGTTGGTDDPAVDVQPCDLPTCPQPAPADDAGVDAAPASVECTPPLPVPDPMPEPAPIEIVLVDAERSLVLLPATDGSADAYLVPAYRFTATDGGTVDLPAVADEALAGPAPTEITGTTVPDTVEPAPVPVPEPQPCEVLEEQDPGSDTTHTIQTCPTPNEDALQIGGDGYYVDIDFSCLGFVLAGRVWIPEDHDEVASWERPGEPFEGGIFTLDSDDHGTFVGDAAETKVADFRPLGPAEDMFCSPQPRS